MAAEVTQLKKNIIKVLDLCILRAITHEYRRVRFTFADTAITKDKQLNKEINIRKELFFNMDENSESFLSIRRGANQALIRLRQNLGFYDMFVAELINKFLSIDFAFARTLRYTGKREADEKKVVRLVSAEDRIELEAEESRGDGENKSSERIFYASEGATGETILREKSENEILRTLEL
jgi:hypothetical protein